MSSTQDAPLCVGDYEAGDGECDGDPEAEASAIQAPCGWRDRCSALQCYLNETDKAVTDFVDHKFKKTTSEVYDEVTGEYTEKTTESEYAVPKGSRDKFVELCEKQAKRYGVKDGTPTKDPVGDPKPKVKKPKTEDRRKNLKPTRRARQAARRALTKRAGERHKMLWLLYEYFLLKLTEELEGSGYEFVKSKEAITRGKLYLVDRLSSSGYISVYSKNTLGRDPALVLAKFKPRDLKLNIALPAPLSAFSAASIKRLRIQESRGGLFQVVANGLGKAELAEVAEIIAGLVQSGKITLPKVAR